MEKTLSGHKADNLIKLKNEGFNVPKFYIISSDSKDIAKLKSKFETWQKANNISAVAVRSSNTLEDAKNSSFAGQFLTVVDVRNSEEFIGALNSVLSSKQSSSYSTKTGGVNAIVQEFIEPDLSGVIFSVNPANGNNQLVINAAQGRGTNVVDGKEAVQYFINRQDLNYISNFNRDNTKELLSSSQIKNLSLTALSIEKLFGLPQDIEWAIKDSTIYILQARPVTSINHLRLWDSSNLAESFPGIVLPLTFSIAKHGYMLGYKAQANAAGLNWYELEINHRTFDAMVGIFNGRMYYNLLNWYKFIALFPGSKRNQKFLDDQISTQGKAVYQEPAKLSIGFKVKFTLRVIYRAIFFRRELNRFYKAFETFETELKIMPKNGDAQMLMQQYVLIEGFIPNFGRSVDNDFFVMTFHGWLKKMLTKWMPEYDFERNAIIGSIKGVLSAEQATSLYDLARKFKADNKALELLRSSDYLSLDRYLESSQLRLEIENYINIFGHRFAEDQKIESVNPVLQPHGMYKLIKVYVQLNDKEIKERLSTSHTKSKNMEALIEAQLKFHQKFIYRLLLRKLKHHLKIREKNRLLRGRVYAHLRELFPKVGQALIDDKVLTEKDDIYFIQIEEIFQLLQASLITNDIQERIHQRRVAYKKFAKIRMPERFITTSLPSLEKIEEVSKVEISNKEKTNLSGMISSPGTVEGRVVVLEEPTMPSQPYDILVARHTDPGWTPLIALAKGVVVEHGGMLSHAAIITRELGIPSIIGVENATAIIKTGMMVRINTQTSSVEILMS